MPVQLGGELEVGAGAGVVATVREEFDEVAKKVVGGTEDTGGLAYELEADVWA